MTVPFNPAQLESAAPDEFAFDAQLGGQVEPRHRSRRRLALIPVAAILVVGAALAIANPFAASAATPSAVTARATTGTIVSSVSLSGSVAAGTVDELSFGAAGTVSAVNVKAGDTVTAGQVLATIDATTLQSQIQTATANLAAAQARLALDAAGPTAATKASAQDSVKQAQLGLTTARQSLSDTYLKNDQSLAQARSAVSSAQSALAADQAASAPAAQIAKDQQAVASAQQALSSAQLNATLAVQQAQNQVASASLGVTSAEHGYALKIVPATAAQIDSDKAAVASAQQALANLQASSATIVSPISGTVTAVNLTVGQSVSGTGSSAGASSSSSSSTTTGQVEVMDLAHLQIAGQASETDIAKLKLGQAATITAAATGSNTVVGQVCSVGQVGTQISGVTSFPVTVCLSGANTGLLVGMSATAAVETSRADNAVIVPSLAVRTAGGQATVTVLGPDGSTQSVVPVTVGITNGSQTQITSGLTAGTTVVETLQTSTSSSPGRGGFGAGRTVTGFGGGFGG
jgi:HlyD family secretion protein